MVNGWFRFYTTGSDYKRQSNNLNSRVTFHTLCLHNIFSLSCQTLYSIHTHLRVFWLGLDKMSIVCYNIDLNRKEYIMTEKKEPIVMPVCPYCKTLLKPKYFTGYYEAWSMWECECEEIPGSEDSLGAYAHASQRPSKSA